MITKIKVIISGQNSPKLPLINHLVNLHFVGSLRMEPLIKYVKYTYVIYVCIYPCIYVYIHVSIFTQSFSE